MSSADIKSMPPAKAEESRMRGADRAHGKTPVRSIPGVLRDGSLHPAIRAARHEGSLMLLRGEERRERRAEIEKGEG